MWIFSDAADWWDEKKRESERYLHEFVDAHYSWWAIAIAGSVQTAMNLGSGFVDTIRIGDGVRQGTLGGILHDGLRLITLLGPVAKLGRTISRVFAPNPAGKICGYVSMSQALRQTGTAHFATYESVAAAAGKAAGGIAEMTEMDAVLRSAGAEIRILAHPETVEAVKDLARANPHGVVMFGIKWLRPNGKIAGHVLYAFRELFGVVKIIDRTGKSVAALSELESLFPGYAGMSKAWIVGATFVKNAQIVTLTSGAATLAMEVRAVILASREKVDAAFERYKALREAGHSPQKAAQSLSDTGGANGPGSKGNSAHPVVIVKPGDTWESILRPFYDSRMGISFQTFVETERGANRIDNPSVPETGRLQPGMRVIIY